MNRYTNQGYETKVSSHSHSNSKTLTPYPLGTLIDFDGVDFEKRGNPSPYKDFNQNG